VRQGAGRALKSAQLPGSVKVTSAIPPGRLLAVIVPLCASVRLSPADVSGRRYSQRLKETFRRRRKFSDANPSRPAGFLP
jgi:hypothetical protein